MNIPSRCSVDVDGFVNYVIILIMTQEKNVIDVKPKKKIVDYLDNNFQIVFLFSDIKFLKYYFFQI